MVFLLQGPLRGVQTSILCLLLGLAGGYLMGAMVMEVIDILSSLRSASLTPLECCTGFESLSGATACVAATGLTVAMLASLITAVASEELVGTFLKRGDRGACGVVLLAAGTTGLLLLAGIGALVGTLLERIVSAMGLVKLVCLQMGFALLVSVLLWAFHGLFPAAGDLFLFPWTLFYMQGAGMCAGLCASGVLDRSEVALFFFFSFLALFLVFTGLGGTSLPPLLLLASALIFQTVVEEDGPVLVSLRAEEATRSSQLLLQAVFLAVLAVMLCEVAVGSALLSYVSDARDWKVSAWAAMTGALLLRATRWSSSMLGVGGSLGALLGVAGAAGVALTLAGEAAGAGHLQQKGSTLGKVAATAGAAAGAFLSLAPPDVHFGVFVALCAVTVTGVLSSLRVKSKWWQ